MKQTFEIKTKAGSDRQIVEQFGYVELRSAYDNGVVDGNLSADEERSNGIEDSASIMGKPTDIFEAYRMNDHIQSVSKSKTGAKSENSVNSQSSAGNTATE